MQMSNFIVFIYKLGLVFNDEPEMADKFTELVYYIEGELGGFDSLW